MMAMIFAKALARVIVANILKLMSEGKLNDFHVRGCVPIIAILTPKTDTIRSLMTSMVTIPYFVNISAIKGFASERERYVIPTYVVRADTTPKRMKRRHIIQIAFPFTFIILTISHIPPHPMNECVRMNNTPKPKQPMKISIPYLM